MFTFFLIENKIIKKFKIMNKCESKLHYFIYPKKKNFSLKKKLIFFFFLNIIQTTNKQSNFTKNANFQGIPRFPLQLRNLDL